MFWKIAAFFFLFSWNSGENEIFYLLMPRFDLNFPSRMIYSGAEIKKAHTFDYLLSRDSMSRVRNITVVNPYQEFTVKLLIC